MRWAGVLLAGLVPVLIAAGLASARPQVRFQGIGARAAVRPATLYLTGDGTLTDVGVRWSSWGGSVAVGHGTADWHGCTPNCAQGRPHHDPATVRLSQIKNCRGRLYYSHATTVTNHGRRFSLGSYAPC